MDKNLKEEFYYSDFYDLGTIERCLKAIDFWKNRVDKEHLKGLQDDTFKAKTISLGVNLELYYVQGERFRDRESTIKEWMERDRRLDESFEKAVEPQGIRCLNCLVQMKIKCKDLWDRIDKPIQVLFMFECPKCQKRKAIFDNGKEYVPKPDHCPKCNKEIRGVYKKEGSTEIWERICGACGFMEREVEDIKGKEDQKKVERLRNEELLKKYRSEFCLSADEGTKYIIECNIMKGFYDDWQRTKQKEADPDYPKVIKLERLKIIELEVLLFKSVGKQKYVKLSLDKPTIDKHVIVSFTVQDADPARKERDSEYQLQKIIKKTLEGTNWRLMNEGVCYRLGYLSGRVKGYEIEDDLLQVVKDDG